MPWSKAQESTAQAVLHGWKPTGSAKGFDRAFAAQVVEESGKKLRKKYRGKSLRDLMGQK